MPEPRILLGVVGRPHGVRGLVHVVSYTADPADLAAYGKLADEAGRLWSVVWRGAGVAELRDAQGVALATGMRRKSWSTRGSISTGTSCRSRMRTSSTCPTWWG